MNHFIKISLVHIFFCSGLHSFSQQTKPFKAKIIYKSQTLSITQIAKNSFIHTSYKQTNDFGKVPCNGVVVRNGNETVVFDTPTTDTTAEELIEWIKTTLHCSINAIIPTHFHDDCLGGLQSFHNNNIPSYAYYNTIELARINKMTIPQNSFSDSLRLKVGTAFILARFFGEGHTKDNIVCYFANENLLFGGCLIKEMNASKGYLGDAVVTNWSATVEKIKQEYPHVKIVVPGHGSYGNKKLLDYTIQLFKTN